MSDKLYGADYWVPEDHLFSSAEECLKKFPDQAAAGVAKPITQKDKDALIVTAVNAASEKLRNFNKDKKKICWKSVSKISHFHKPSFLKGVEWLIWYWGKQ